MIYKGDDKTRRIIKILAVFMLSVPLLISPAAAWPVQTHQNMASKVYYSLPLSVQNNLNLNEMKKGAIAPDAVFKDFNNHKYPQSIAQAQKWLNNGKKAYKSKNYKYASYCFGIALHYITDTYVAAHCVSTETKAQNTAFESKATKMTPTIRYMSGNLNLLLYYGYQQGKSDWKTWLKTKSSSIAQKEVNNGASAAYSMIRNCV